jgi:hypothetical protein
MRNKKKKEKRIFQECFQKVRIEMKNEFKKIIQEIKNKKELEKESNKEENKEKKEKRKKKIIIFENKIKIKNIIEIKKEFNETKLIYININDKKNMTILNEFKLWFYSDYIISFENIRLINLIFLKKNHKFISLGIQLFFKKGKIKKNKFFGYLKINKFDNYYQNNLNYLKILHYNHYKEHDYSRTLSNIYLNIPPLKDLFSKSIYSNHINSSPLFNLCSVFHSSLNLTRSIDYQSDYCMDLIVKMKKIGYVGGVKVDGLNDFIIDEEERFSSYFCAKHSHNSSSVREKPTYLKTCLLNNIYLLYFIH